MEQPTECTTPLAHPTTLIDAPLSLITTIREYFLQTLTATPFVRLSVSKINVLLTWAQVPEKSLLTNEEFVLTLTAGVVTLVGYYVLFGKRHGRKRKRLAEELRLAQKQVRFLEDELLLAKREDMFSSTPTRPSKSREIRIFMDGAFDVMHYGHMNAFRLGRSLGTYLIVGVNSDESITQCKGPPLMNDKERMTMVEGCKFVDEVVPNCPYIMTSEYLEFIFEKYGVDYVVHGDDPCVVDGKDVYESAKRRGRYRSIPRTEGVSTTDIVGRMLLMTKDHHLKGRIRANSAGSVSVSGMGNSSSSIQVDGNLDDDSDNEIHNENADDDAVSSAGEIGVLGRQSKFLTTSMMLRLFSAGVKPPKDGMKVIYVDGAWDMFHCGHVEFLKEALKRGDYLIVGIHGDSVVNKRRGGNLPLMNLHERVLSVLGCKYINDVLIDAPLEITPDMIASLKITEVVHGTESDDNSGETSLGDRYRYPKEMGILASIKSPSTFTLGNIVSRIQKKQTELQAKIERKKKAEREWFDNKYSTSISNGGDNSNGNSK
eukprot:CAMPEP_0171342984 /NCGR_PEP_ID=MMETSP0878-20121228/15927_1 /TAXON_ID=67004 /ORGANISM="Thalassiosira weissflogii, Strain CCMP1336" /LENGTH=542 /DNA_ID=CAMNT_0011845807 /DNA_START=17 /DNA_END=1642 /DNA_ORIENTATION=-